MTCKWFNHHRSWKHRNSNWETEKAKQRRQGAQSRVSFRVRENKSKLRKLGLKTEGQQTSLESDSCIFNSGSFDFWWTFAAPGAGKIWRPFGSKLQPSIYGQQWAAQHLQVTCCMSLCKTMSVGKPRLSNWQHSDRGFQRRPRQLGFLFFSHFEVTASCWWEG